MAELHAEILLHAKQESTGVVPQPIEGITVHDSDVLEPEPARPGGLMRGDTVHVAVLFPMTYLLIPSYYSGTPSGNQ